MLMLSEGRCFSMPASRRPAWRLLVVPVIATLALLLAGAARADAAAPSANPCAPGEVTNFLGADATHPGVISLYFFHAEGAPVTYYECVRGDAQRLGAATTEVGRADGPDRRDDLVLRSPRPALRRHRAAARRLARGRHLQRPDDVVRRALRAHRPAPGRVRGDAPRPRRRQLGHRRHPAGSLRHVPARRAAVLAHRLPARGFGREPALPRAHAGRVRVELRIRDRRVRSTAVAVGVDGARATSAPPTVVATGDSMMQGIDGFLADDLGDAATVRSDVRAGTAIGKSLDWLSWSRTQVSRFRPAATVIAIGANEGWPMQTPGGATVECCGAGVGGRVRPPRARDDADLPAPWPRPRRLAHAARAARRQAHADLRGRQPRDRAGRRRACRA